MMQTDNTSPTFGQPAGEASPGYGAQQPGYGGQQPGYGAQQPGYGAPPAGTEQMQMQMQQMQMQQQMQQMQQMQQQMQQLQQETQQQKRLIAQLQQETQQQQRLIAQLEFNFSRGYAGEGSDVTASSPLQWHNMVAPFHPGQATRSTPEEKPGSLFDAIIHHEEQPASKRDSIKKKSKEKKVKKVRKPKAQPLMLNGVEVKPPSHSGYQLFSDRNRAAAKEALATAGGKPIGPEIVTELGARWGKLAEAVKDTYKAEVVEQKRHYAEAKSHHDAPAAEQTDEASAATPAQAAQAAQAAQSAHVAQAVQAAQAAPAAQAALPQDVRLMGVPVEPTQPAPVVFPPAVEPAEPAPAVFPPAVVPAVRLRFV
jgi:hypothetical protein